MKNWPWYGYIIFALVVFALAFFFYFKPRNAELQTIKEERLKVEKEVAGLLEKKKQLDQIEAELAGLNTTLKELEQIIPLRKETADILRRIQQMAFDSRLDIVKFTPKGLVNLEFYSEWPIPIEIRGNYHNLASFFDRLSKFPRIFNVENFAIKSLANQTEEQTISSTFTTKTYVFLEETIEPPAGQEVKRRAQ